MIKAAAYIRKSTSGADETGVERQEGSFDRQRTSIVDYAKRRDLEIVKWYEEPVSGKSIRKRKRFLEMIRDAESMARPFQAIIFESYDRFMRNVKEAGRYEATLDDAGVELHFTNLKNDGSFGDELHKSISKSMATEYSRELARKTVQGMMQKAKAASWLGGTPPYGYRALRNKETRLMVLEVHDSEAAVMRDIFSMALKGLGHRRIAARLNQMGVPSPDLASKRKAGAKNRNPDGRWASGSIACMLRNCIYKGTYRWNKNACIDRFDWRLEGQGTVEVGKIRSNLPVFRREGGAFINRTKPSEEWVTKENAVPAIISAKNFDRLQSRFQKRGTWMRGNHVKYLMAGVLRCACGNACFGHRHYKTLEVSGVRTPYDYYRCNGDVTKGTHPKSTRKSHKTSGPRIWRPMIRLLAVDEVVTAGILKRAEQFVDLSRVKELFRNRIASFLKSAPDRLSEVTTQIEKIDHEADRTIETYTKYGRPIPEERMNELKAHRAVLEAERMRLVEMGHEKLVIDADLEAARFFEMVKDVKRTMVSGEAIERIRIRERFLETAEVDWTSSPAVLKLSWLKVPRFDFTEDARWGYHLAGKPEREETIEECYEYRDCQLVLT